MDWTTPLAVLGWLIVGLLMVGCVLFLLAFSVSVRNFLKEDKIPAKPEPRIIREREVICPHCEPPGMCPVLNSDTYKNGLS